MCSSLCVVRCLSVAAVVLSSASVVVAQTAVLEPFETTPSTWLVASDLAGGGQVAPTAAPVASGVAAARLSTSAANGVAQVRTSFSDAAAAHTWNERPGTFRWQRASVFVPAATVAALGPADALTLAGFWPSATPTQGWFLRVRVGGQLSIVGTRDTGTASEFPVFATVPVDRWFTLELGLHSQLGPGVKRAFAVFIDGVAHGWFRQGRMVGENYDRVAVGILGTTVAGALEVVVDDWGVAGTTATPTGPDARSTASLVAKDFRSGSGADWQIDWSTWANDLRLHPTFGLYSNLDRLQSGVNHDRAPSFADGWGEIEIDWPKGQPIDIRPTGYFGPMIGFRKEINREQNLEVIPIGNGDGTVDLVFEAWDGLGPTILARAPLPVASFGGSSIPEPGDIIRARWTQVTPTALDVRASYFDASAGTWAHDLIAGVYDISAISGVNFTDGFHLASSVTIDSPFYAIRRYHAGTPDTYPGASTCLVDVSPATVNLPAGGGTGSLTITADPACGWAAAANPWIALTGATGTGNGAFEYNVGANPGPQTRLGQIAVGGRIVPVTQAALPTLQIGNASATEGTLTPGTASFVVTLSAPSPVPVQVDYATVAGSAAAGADFVAAAGTATIAAGTLTTTIPVTLVSDAVPESPEAFQVTLANPLNATVADAVGDGAIVDDDAPAGPIAATVAIAAGVDDVNEIGTTLTATGATLFVGTANGASYAGLRFVGVPVPAGATVTSARVEVRAASTQWNSMQFEWAAEASGNAAVFSATSRPSQRILGTPRVAHSTNQQWVGGTWYALEQLAPLLQDVVNRPDWAAGNSMALVIRGTGPAWGRKFFSAFESGAANAARLVVTYTAAGGPPPPPPLPALSVNDVTLVEGTGTATSAVFTVTLSAASSQTVTVSYTATPGTATTPADFTATSGTLTFAPGVTSQTVTVPVVADAVVEPTETFTLTLSGPTNATVAEGSGTATITNDDVAPLPALSVNDVTVVEGTGTTTAAVFTVTLSAASSQTVTVGYTTTNGTATAPADFTAASGTLTFAPGVTSQTVTVSIVAEAVVEPTEAFTLTVSAPTNATLADASGAATITNDDVAAVPTLSVNDVTLAEGTGAATSAVFTVTLSAASSQTVTVGYTTAPGTATTPADFTATTGTLTFVPGVTSQTATVPVVADAVVEPTETFTLTLSGPTNATVADGSGTATITNDDMAAGPATITVPVAVGGDDVNQEGTSFSAGSSTIWMGTGAPSVAALTGLRFAGVAIPRNATITAARLEVQASSTQWLSIGFEIGAEAAGTSLPFSAAAPPSGRVLLTPRVAHSSNTQWVSGTWYSFADLTPLLQALVARPDWDAGNALALVMRGTGSAYGRKFARSFEAGAATAPRLVISYVVP